MKLIKSDSCTFQGLLPLVYHASAKAPANVATVFGEDDNVKALQNLVETMEVKPENFDESGKISKLIPGDEVGHEIHRVFF